MILWGWSLYKNVELVTELERKEKEAGIVPDPEVNYFMKVKIFTNAIFWEHAVMSNCKCLLLIFVLLTLKCQSKLRWEELKTVLLQSTL